MAICKNSPFELDNTESHGSDDNGGGSSDNDMWNLVRPDLRSVSDAFVSLLSANGRSAGGDRCQWEKKQPSYSRNSSFNGFQLCTEGLGCESCDGLADSDDSSSSFSSSSSSPVIDEGGDALAEEEEDGDYYDDDDDDIEGGGDLPVSEEDNFSVEEDGGDSPVRQKSNFSAEEDDNYVENSEVKARREEINGTKNASPTFRKFPPPLPSISRTNASSVFMRSYKKDGRFVLQAVKVPSSKYLQAFREGGRLKMQLIRTEDELPEGDDSDEQNDDPVDDEDDAACPEPESCSDCDDLAVGKPGADLAPANDRKAEFFGREYFVEAFECFARQNYLAFVNAGILFNSECENADDDGGVSNKRRSSGRLNEMKPAHVSVKSRAKPRAASGGLNIYYGWRTALQRTPEFCQETQSLQKSPSPSTWLLRYPLSVQRCAGSDNERRCHSLPKFRSEELAYGRCQEAKASSVWPHCVATST